MVDKKEDPNGHLSRTAVEEWLKRWGPLSLGILVVVIVIVYFSRSGTSSNKLYSNEPIPLVSDSISSCKLEKTIAGLKVTNEVSIKGTFLESIITISPSSSCYSASSSKESNESSFGINNSTIPSINSQIPSKSNQSYDQEASIINGIHVNLLRRRILSGRWTERMLKADVLDFNGNEGSILENASFVSVKFIVFGNDTTKERKASYATRDVSFKVHELPIDPPLTFSKFWQFKKSTGCFASQQSEMVVVPMKHQCNECEHSVSKLLQSGNILGRCLHSTRQIIINQNLTEQMPNVITSVLVCH